MTRVKSALIGGSLFGKKAGRRRKVKRSKKSKK